MNVTIPKELESYIAEEIESGRFADASAVVSDALRLHEEHLALLRQELAKGFDDLSQGRHRSIEASEFLARARAARP